QPLAAPAWHIHPSPRPRRAPPHSVLFAAPGRPGGLATPPRRPGVGGGAARLCRFPDQAHDAAIGQAESLYAAAAGGDNPARCVSLETVFSQALESNRAHGKRGHGPPRGRRCVAGLYRPDQFGAGNHLGAAQRLLVANSLMIGALAICPTALWQDKWAALAMIAAGLLISAAWLAITVEGFSAMKRHAKMARGFVSVHFK